MFIYRLRRHVKQTQLLITYNFSIGSHRKVLFSEENFKLLVCDQSQLRLSRIPYVSRRRQQHYWRIPIKAHTFSGSIIHYLKDISITVLYILWLQNNGNKYDILSHFRMKRKRYVDLGNGFLDDIDGNYVKISCTHNLLINKEKLLVARFLNIMGSVLSFFLL